MANVRSTPKTDRQSEALASDAMCHFPDGAAPSEQSSSRCQQLQLKRGTHARSFDGADGLHRDTDLLAGGEREWLESGGDEHAALGETSITVVAVSSWWLTSNFFPLTLAVAVGVRTAKSVLTVGAKTPKPGYPTARQVDLVVHLGSDLTQS